MPRTVSITLSPEKTDALVAEVVKINGLIGLRVQRNISLKPPGDVLSLEIKNSAISDLMMLLNKDGLLDDHRHMDHNKSDCFQFDCYTRVTASPLLKLYGEMKQRSSAETYL